MVDNNDQKTAKPGNGFLYAAGALALLFIVNVVVGKISVVQGATTPVGVGDVGEFLILVLAVVLFVIVCLKRERAKNQSSGSQSSKGQS